MFPQVLFCFVLVFFTSFMPVKIFNFNIWDKSVPYFVLFNFWSISFIKDNKSHSDCAPRQFLNYI